MSTKLSFDPEHPPLKWLRKLSSGRSEASEQYCLAEGWKCIEEAWAWSPPHLIVVAEKAQAELDNKNWSSRCAVQVVSQKDFDSLCSTQTPEGVLGVFNRPAVGHSAPPAHRGEVHLGLFQWRDPSNIGAAIRSARGLGAASVTLLGTGPDFFSPKVIRCSMGSVFHIPLARIETDLSLLSDFQVVMAAAGGASSRLFQPQSRSIFLLIGSESHGLPPEFLKQAGIVGVPLVGQLESLSAPIASALLLDHLLFPRLAKEN